MATSKRIAIFCVGNKLMYDDGLGPAVYGELASYEFPSSVEVFDLGCLTMDRINDVAIFDTIITIDAIDNSGQESGTIFRFTPQDMASREFGTTSLHDLKLADLFEAAALLGHSCEGLCFGMQVENAHPACVHVGLSPAVEAKLADLVDCVLAELVQRGVDVVVKNTGEKVHPGFHHTNREGHNSLLC